MLLIFDLDDTLIPRLPDNYTPKDLKNLRLLPGAEEILTLNLPGVNKILVTKEIDMGLQNKKIDAVGIRNYFTRIMICFDDPDKRNCFRDSSERYQDKDVWIIGDRLDSEIRYGNKLGFKTIRLKQGKYKDLEPKDDSEIPTVTINSLTELAQVLNLSNSNIKFKD
ncbi:MAG TPA: HAD hydrolase-like protein [Candidatus Nanoarchaeia archaeon]|nr:HAD hydrolase-like protein [Candidatus Nanoarchaeia archaeon]